MQMFRASSSPPPPPPPSLSCTLQNPSVLVAWVHLYPEANEHSVPPIQCHQVLIQHLRVKHEVHELWDASRVSPRLGFAETAHWKELRLTRVLHGVRMLRISIAIRIKYDSVRAKINTEIKIPKQTNKQTPGTISEIKESPEAAFFCPELGKCMKWILHFWFFLP